MHLYRTKSGFFVAKNDHFYKISTFIWDDLVNRDDLHEHLSGIVAESKPSGDFRADEILAPIGTQEVWAAGVTYFRSRVARMEESKDSGGDTFYDKVYEAERPELFFKATARRVVGHLGNVQIRPDSTWDVPEPEWTLFATSSGKIVAYSIGNDMSSRSIEGENPLYLPQAKVYDGSAALGPCLYVPAQPMSADTRIAIDIERSGMSVFSGQTTLHQLKRKPDELVSYLFHTNSFPSGVFLMTGTGIVPNNDFTLQKHDKIKISIENVGELINTVA